MCRVILTKYFKKQLKPYVKKYKSLLFDIKYELVNFDKKRSVSLGHNLFKLRVRCNSLSKGKNKAFRMIIYLSKRSLIVPIAIFLKSKKINMQPKEIKYHLKLSLMEIRLYPNSKNLNPSV